MPPHPSTNFEMQKYHKDEPRFNGLYSRDNLPKRNKDEAYIITFDEYANVGTHWIVLYCTEIKVIYFSNFGVEHVTEKIKEFTGHKNIKTNIFIKMFNAKR